MCGAPPPWLFGGNCGLEGAGVGGFARELLARGAAKVYATAAAAKAQDVDLLINNAGVSTYTNLVTGDLDKIKLELDTHFWGTLHVIRAFAPLLKDGAILNVLSALSWITYDGATAYAVGKAAEWSLTNGVRLELAAQNTLVTGLLLGAADTDMMAGFDIPKADPAQIVRAALDGIEAGDIEVLADETAKQAKATLSGDPRLVYPTAV